MLLRISPDLDVRCRAKTLVLFLNIIITLFSPTLLASSDIYRPRTIFGSGGVSSINILSSSYAPYSALKPSMTLGLDLPLPSRWLIGIRTLTTQDDSLGGTRIGLHRSVLHERSVLMPTNSASASHGNEVNSGRYAVSTIPNYSFEIGLGLGRWVISQTLESSLPFVPLNLKNVPIKVPLYGLYISLLAEHHFTENWGAFLEYHFIYATGQKLNLLCHSIQIGPRLWL